MRKSIKRTLALILALLMVGIAYLWLTFVSSFGYNPTGELPTIDEDETYSVFVYGTLTRPWVRWLVTGRAGTSEPAILPGFRKKKLDIKPDPDASVAGEVIEVSASELRALDRYERLGVRYERVELTLQDGRSAWVYRLMEPLILELE
ncbi:gamma-glutamylcyclotransferase (GGCT)/AIG2-like uncharacterized protein YtfP [Marinobacter sp. MBR-99]|jgi:gamma-glutamylcyclotransferase (GGCT)/AIG2-like uncharacterized protein YtfP|uniref:gamma-glutamylcyclotransferase family protein n=1 Tax=Marinobacter sp. MBR-99 TaxID=3156461 RepID=UPI003395367B